MPADIEKKIVKEDSEHEHAHGHEDGCCDHDHDHDHEHDNDNDNSESGEEGEEEDNENGKVLNRNEKKARKLLGKLGLKAVTGIERVTIKRARMIFAIANPTVYKTSNDSYIVFGEAKVEDAGFQAQAMAAQRLAAAAQRDGDNGNAGGNAGNNFGTDGGKEKVKEANDDADEDDGQVVDATDIDEKDIRIVMEQTNVSRSKAIKALRANNNDIVNTIMELTM